MGTVIIYSILGIVTVVIQSSLVPLLGLRDVKPDLVLIIVIYLGLFRPLREGIFAAFFLGYIEDLAVGYHLGLFAFIRVFILLVTHTLMERFSFKGRPFQLILVFFLSLATELLLSFLLYISGSPAAVKVLKTFYLIVILNTVVAAGVFPFLDRFDRLRELFLPRT